MHVDVMNVEIGMRMIKKLKNWKVTKAVISRMIKLFSFKCYKIIHFLFFFSIFDDMTSF